MTILNGLPRSWEQIETKLGQGIGYMEIRNSPDSTTMGGSQEIGLEVHDTIPVHHNFYNYHIATTQEDNHMEDEGGDTKN